MRGTWWIQNITVVRLSTFYVMLAAGRIKMPPPNSTLDNVFVFGVPRMFRTLTSLRPRFVHMSSPVAKKMKSTKVIGTHSGTFHCDGQSPPRERR